MSVIEKTKELTDILTPVLGDEKIREVIGEEKVEAIMTAVNDLDQEISDPRILDDIKRNTVTSFDDWDERVKGLVEFYRPNNTMTEFEIQSMTAAEVKKVEAMHKKAQPVVPEMRQKSPGKPDMNDKHYAVAMKAYDEEVQKAHDLYILWILEHGLLFDIPGKDDDEKLEHLNKTVAGDAVKIADAITDISNLTPDAINPFLKL